jgi:cytochrome c oxidase subunit 4
MEERRFGGMSYVLAWLALLVLTAASFGASRLSLGSLAPPVALGIAAIKAAIVLLVFMHLIEASTPVRAVLLTALVFIALLCAGIAADVATR